MKFLLEINLGNDAMRSDDDITDALWSVRERIYYDGIVLHKIRKNILDRNGNIVGHYEVVE